MTSPAHLRDAALAYVARGRRVLPCWWLLPDGRCACGGRTTSCRPGKHPLGPAVPHGPEGASADPAIVLAWWERYPAANIGLMMGAGMVALDVDSYRGGDATLAAIVAEHGELPTTPRARTGSGGWHMFFAVDREVRFRKLGQGLEVIGDGNYVVAPPSRTTGPYERVTPPDMPLAWAPAWIYPPARIEVAAPAVALPADDRLLTRARAYLAAMPHAISGSGGHAATFRAALAMVHGFGLSLDDALLLLIEDYNPRCLPPWTEKELRHKIASAAKADRAPSRWLAEAPSPSRPVSRGEIDRFTVQHAKLRRRQEDQARPPIWRVTFDLLSDDGEPITYRVVVPSSGYDGTAICTRYRAALPDVDPAELRTDWDVDVTQRFRGRRYEVERRDGEVRRVELLTR